MPDESALIRVTIKRNHPRIDLIVQLGEQEHVCDIYYFVHDPAAGRRGRNWRTALRTMLDEWIRVVEGLSVGKERYVPFDLADQGSTWLRLEVDIDDLLSVSSIGSGPPGYSFYPTDFAEAEREVRPRGPIDEAPTVRMTRSSFISCIKAPVEEL